MDNQPDDREHIGCGDDWVNCRNPYVTHPKEMAENNWWRKNNRLSIADNDVEGKLGGTQFNISITGTREQLEMYGIDAVERWVKYLKSQLKESNA